MFPDPVFVINSDGVITHWNSSAEELLGVHEREVKGKTPIHHIGSDGEKGLGGSETGYSWYICFLYFDFGGATTTLDTSITV